jgi:hypothetical protein
VPATDDARRSCGILALTQVSGADASVTGMGRGAAPASTCLLRKPLWEALLEPLLWSHPRGAGPFVNPVCEPEGPPCHRWPDGGRAGRVNGPVGMSQIESSPSAVHIFLFRQKNE